MIVTFYSYKGGVGRSLALANIACLLAQDHDHPQRVLTWDFDLEAPGLHRMLPPKEPVDRGFLDLVHKFCESKVIPPVRNYIYASVVNGVDVLPAGTISSVYAAKLQEIDWPQLFANGSSDAETAGPFFTQLMKDIHTLKYDYVLIDSRTGFSDQAAIATQVLADAILVLFRLNQQNLDGVEHLVPTIREELAARGKSNVVLLPVASAVATSAAPEVHELRKRAAAFFGGRLRDYIRFDPDLVMLDRVVAEETIARSLWPVPPVIDDYKRLCRSIRRMNIKDTRSLSDRIVRGQARGEYAIALEMARNVIIARPRLTSAWSQYEQSIIYQPTKREDIVRFVETVLASDRTNPFALNLRSEVTLAHASGREDKTKLSAAEEDLRQALTETQSPSDSRIVRRLALLMSAQGRASEAIALLEQSLVGNEPTMQLRLLLAWLYVRAGASFFGNAIKQYEDLSASIGFERHAHLLLLKAFVGDVKGAEAHLQAARESKAGAHLSENVGVMEAWMRLFGGQRSRALELARDRETRETRASRSELVNLMEFYLGAQEFERMDAVAEMTKTRDEGDGDDDDDMQEVELLLALRSYLITGKDREELVRKWVTNTWNYRELFITREHWRREDPRGTFVERLGIIEEFAREDDFAALRHSRLVPVAE